MAEAPEPAPETGWDKVAVEVPDDGLKEALVGEFSEDGLTGVWERPLEGERSELVLYFGAALPPLAVARIGRIFQRNGHDLPRISAGREEWADWTREWRKGFSSFPIGKRFRIVPSWEPIDGEDPRIVLRIDPGMAFGTGSHETTRMVLEALERQPKPVRSVLDIGTGSGILAIAAVKLGSETVVACDTDRDAVTVAARNLRRNRTPLALFVGSADSLKPEGFDLVLANLSLDALAELSSDIRRVLRPRGAAVLSGILISQKEPLGRSLVMAGLRVEQENTEGEWMAVTVVGEGA